MARGLTDRELFEQLPLGDTWDDADLTTVFCYLLHRSSTSIPDCWIETMKKFESELKASVGADPSLVAEYNTTVLGQ